MIFLAQELLDPTLAAGLGGALATVGLFALAKLGPFVSAWFKGHGHPVAGELAAVIAEIGQEHEHGKSYLEAVETTIKSPEARDLVDRAIAAFAKKNAPTPSDPPAKSEG